MNKQTFSQLLLCVLEKSSASVVTRYVYLPSLKINSAHKIICTCYQSVPENLETGKEDACLNPRLTPKEGFQTHSVQWRAWNKGQVPLRGQLSMDTSSANYERAGLSTSQTMWTRRKEAQQAQSEWEGLTFQLLHQTKGLRNSFPPGRSSPALRETRPWCTACLGWRSRGSSPTSWSPASPAVASDAAGNSAGALSDTTDPNPILSLRGLKTAFPYTPRLLLLSQSVLGRFCEKSQLGHLSEAKPWWNYGTSLQSSCHKDREKKILCRKERCYGRYYVWPSNKIS